MNILIWIVSGQMLALIAHWSIWRIHLPKRQVTTIFYIFLAAGISVAVLGNLPHTRFFDPEIQNQIRLTKPLEYIYWLVTHLCLTLSYMITYTAIEGESPSFTLLLAIHKSGARGLSVETLHSLIPNDQFIGTRITAMLDGKLVVKNPKTERIQIAAKGSQMLNTFLLPRRLIVGNRKGG